MGVKTNPSCETLNKLGIEIAFILYKESGTNQ
jgi:hypothetical protein